MPQERAIPRDDLDREIEEFLREHDESRRPDRRRPRGNPDIEHDDAARSRDALERVLGW